MTFTVNVWLIPEVKKSSSILIRYFFKKGFSTTHEQKYVNWRKFLVISKCLWLFVTLLLNVVSSSTLRRGIIYELLVRFLQKFLPGIFAENILGFFSFHPPWDSSRLFPGDFFFQDSFSDSCWHCSRGFFRDFSRYSINEESRFASWIPFMEFVLRFL